MPTLETHNGYPLWRYIPNVGAAGTFVALFALATAPHVWVMVKRRSWFCIPFVIGGLCKSRLLVYLSSPRRETRVG